MASASADAARVSVETLLELSGEDTPAAATTLVARGMGLTDIGPPFAPFTSLEVLSLSDNELTSLAGIRNMPHLTSLNVNLNRIASLEPLAHCPMLAHLYASNNKISSVAPLAACRNLASISLYRNQIPSLESTVGTLARLPKLAELDLASNPCALGPPYRHRIISSLRFLKTFDGDTITSLDHELAADFLSRPEELSREAYTVPRPGTAEAVVAAAASALDPHFVTSCVLTPHRSRTHRHPGSAQRPRTTQQPATPQRPPTAAEMLASVRPSISSDMSHLAQGGGADVLVLDGQGVGCMHSPMSHSKGEERTSKTGDSSPTRVQGRPQAIAESMATPGRLFRDPFLNTNPILLEYMADAAVAGQASQAAHETTRDNSTANADTPGSGGSILSLRRPMVERLRLTAAAMDAAGSEEVTKLMANPIFQRSETPPDETVEQRTIRQLISLVQQLTLERDEACARLQRAQRQAERAERVPELESIIERLRRENISLRNSNSSGQISPNAHGHAATVASMSRPTTASTAAQSKGVSSNTALGIDDL